MCALPVTDDSCISQQFKDPQQLQPEKIPPLSALLVLRAQTGCVSAVIVCAWVCVCVFVLRYLRPSLQGFLHQRMEFFNQLPADTQI